MSVLKQKRTTSKAEFINIRHLREKLEAEPGAPQFLRTVRGIGYKLTKGEEA